MKNAPKQHPAVFLSFHEHWVALIPAILELFFSLVFFGFLWFISGLLSEVSFSGSAVAFLLTMILLLFVFHRFFLSLITWEISSYTVTDKFIIGFQNNLLTESDVTYITIAQIDEIEKRKHGVFSNLLRYGDVYVNVAAAPYPIAFKRLPYPGDFTNLVKAIRDNRIEDEVDIDMYRQIYGRKFRYFLKKAL